VFNANPLMRYDGYYILADWLEIPNLRDRCNRYLKNLMLDKCLGVEVQPEAYMALWRRVLFVVYAIVSYIYRWVVTYSILFFMYSFLKPYKLGVISAFLAIFAAGSMVGWPLFRLAKNLNRRGRLPDMNPAKVTLSAAFIVALVLFAFVMPLPVSRVRQVALVQPQAEGLERVPIRESGILEKLYVQDGQHVSEGDRLADFSSSQLEYDRSEIQAQCSILTQKLDALGRLKETEANDPDRLRQDSVKVKADLDTETKKLINIRRQIKELTLLAHTSGTVMSPPRPDDVGKYFEKGTKEAPKPFCLIGDPKRLRVAMPVTPADYHLLETDLKAMRAEGKDLDIEIRIQGRDSKIWKGKLATLPQEDAKEIPGPLSSSMNGPIAVKPATQSGGRFIPQTQQYLIYIDIIDPDTAIRPGNMAQVKVHCQWRTAAWWVWRTISNTFDLGLI
jgi:putative peptide zinc metalloprotease protein